MWKSIEVRLSPGFFALPLLALGWGAGEVLPHVLLAALCHELGHLTALGCFGVCPECIILGTTGVEIRAAGQARLSYGGELCCVLAGPVINLVLALLAARLADAYVFAGANAILAVYNLLPVRNLDGGRALWLFIARWTEPFTAERVTGIVNLVALSLLLGGGGILLWYSGRAVFCLAGAVGLLIGQVLQSCRRKQGCQTGEKQIQ